MPPEAVVLAAVWRSPAAAAAGARWASAGALAELAGLGAPAALAAEAEHHSEGHPWTLGLSVERPFTRAALRDARLDAARAEQAARRLDAARAAWEARGGALAALFALLAADSAASLARREAELRAEEEALVEGRRAAGLASPAEADRARAAARAARLAGAAAGGRRGEALAALAARLGVAADDLRGRAFPVPGGAWLPAAAPDYAPLVRRALAGRSDVGAALARYGAAESELRARLAESLPGLTLGPGILWDQKDFVFRLVGAVVPAPRRAEARVRHAEALRGEAAAAFRETQARALAGAGLAAAAAEAARADLAAAAAERGRAEALVGAAEAGIRAGAGDSLGLVRRRLGALAAERAEAAARHRAMAALAALETALERALEGAPLPAGEPWLPAAAPGADGGAR